ncbi:MAG: sensor histidine kinase [Wolinella sp.]
MQDLDLSKLHDSDILGEIARRFEEKNASIFEMEQMTKKLLTLNEKTKQAESIKGEFLSIIKNEFNNPLSTLLNLAGVLGQKRESQNFEMMVAMLHSELLKLDFHFKNIFAATEIEAGEIASFYTTIDFEALFEEAKKGFVYLIEDKNLTLTVENRLEEKIVSDYSKLLLILANLLSNACEYSYPQGEVKVSLSEEGEEFVIAVKDQGEGIDTAHQATIFDRFTKFSSGKTRAHSGLGLGLSVVLGMSEALGGRVRFLTHEGATLFLVHLPKCTKEMTILGEMDDSGMTLFEDFEGGVEL